MEFIHLFPNQYSYPTTITMCMLKTGYFVKFIPLDTICKRAQGKSNIRPFRDGVKFINIMIRIIMLFDPQKVFLPTGLLLFGTGLAITIEQLISKYKVTGSGLMLFLAGLFIVLIGLLADQVAAMRRELNRPR